MDEMRRQPLPAVATAAVLHVGPADEEVAGVGGESSAREGKYCGHGPRVRGGRVVGAGV